MNTRFSPSAFRRSATRPGPVAGIVFCLAMFLALPGGFGISRAVAATPDPAGIPAPNAAEAAPDLFPAANATNVCPDTPLRLTFATPQVLGASGKIQIRDAALNAVVETIDVSSPTNTKTIGGSPNYKYYPVIVSGRQATIYPKNGGLTYGKTYSITIEAGVFKGASANATASTSEPSPRTSDARTR